ncbi:hypothetical protein Lalb_Chr11g0069091 [Lupinus albus]|uniref:Uncharacterized protein n=1 Tax=Lupinus albus TaxID=3870 RepID=A0A6A4PRD3_LUPAL|nr:hypothetical protein Lalb_Chr11g0069091 [Lupinus albus]
MHQLFQKMQMLQMLESLEKQKFRKKKQLGKHFQLQLLWEL